MAKKLLLICMMTAILTSLFTPVVRAAEPIYLYVDSLLGNDGNMGISLVQSFKTIGKAKETVAAIISNGLMNSDIIVYIRAGDYFIDNTINFRAEDSGKNGFTVHYAGYPGDAKPRIIGGQKVKGWTLDKDGVYKADVGTGWIFNSLYVNGEPADMARWPKKSAVSGRWTFLYANPGVIEWGDAHWYKFGFNPADFAASGLGNFNNLVGAQIHCHPTNGTRSDEYAFVSAITGVDPVNNIITLRDDAIDWGRRSDGAITGNASWLAAGDGAPYYIMGIRDFLTDENEFSLDKKTGTLYYKPKSGANINNLEIIAPKTVGIFNLNNASYISFEGLQIEAADREEFIPAWSSWRNALIVMNSSQYITIDGCGLYNSGDSLVSFNNGSNRNINIINSHMKNAGYSALNLQTGGNNNTIDSNLIENVGLVNGYSWAIGIWGATNLNITHNKVKGSAGPAIYTYNTLNNCHFSYNEFIDCMQFGNDFGVIYFIRTNGTGNFIEYNYVHDCGNKLGPVVGTPHQILHALYFDTGANNFTVKNNVFAEMASGYDLFYIYAKGKSNTFENNIIYQSGSNPALNILAGVVNYDDGRPGATDDLKFRNNIYYLPGGGCMYHIWSWAARWNPGVFTQSDYNLLYFPGSSPSWVWIAETEKNSAFTLAEWRAEYGFDQHSVTGQNPLFTDAANGDFSLRDGSPAKGLGFKEIDQSKIGPDRLSWFFLTSKVPGITVSNIQKITEGNTISIKGDIVNTTGKPVRAYFAKYKNGRLIDLDSDITAGSGSFSVTLPERQNDEKMKLMIWTDSTNPVIDYIQIY